MQQIMYFDKYVKDNIDYGFEALTYQEELKKQGIKGIDTNPYKSALCKGK